MTDKLPSSDRSKPSQPNSSNVGQYVPQVFMVPYYAPHPGYNNFSPNQQHPPVFGQMPNGMQSSPIPGPMPMPGMPGPMPMHSLPTQSVATKSPQVSKPPTTSPQTQNTSKGALNENIPNSESQPSTQHNLHHIHVPRACWTYVEEEVLVNVYSEFTFGKSIRKITKFTWEAIAERLCQESRKKLPQVTKKTWMQCKDKWNNMVKKHKYRRGELINRINRGEYNAIEREGVFEALERILNYENQPVLCNNFEQGEVDVDDEHDRVTMVSNRNEKNVVESSSRFETFYNEETSAPNLDEVTAAQRIEAESAHYDAVNEERSEGENNNTNEQMQDNNNMDALDSPLNSPIQSLKRPNDNNNDDNMNKRLRMDKEENNRKDLLYNLLLRQTDLLEQSRNHHNELLDQIRISEENTRMMILQSIKDLTLILDRLIKNEK